MRRRETGAITWPDFDAWQRVTGSHPNLMEFQAIEALDLERVIWLNKPASERQKMIPATAKSLGAALRSLAGKPKPVRKRGGKNA